MTSSLVHSLADVPQVVKTLCYTCNENISVKHPVTPRFVRSDRVTFRRSWERSKRDWVTFCRDRVKFCSDQLATEGLSVLACPHVRLCLMNIHNVLHGNTMIHPVTPSQAFNTCEMAIWYKYGFFSVKILNSILNKLSSWKNDIAIIEEILH